MKVDVLTPVVDQIVCKTTIGTWLAHTGDRVRKGQPIAELETAAAVFELVAPADGTLRVLVASEATVPESTIIAVIEPIVEERVFPLPLPYSVNEHIAWPHPLHVPVLPASTRISSPAASTGVLFSV